MEGRVEGKKTKKGEAANSHFWLHHWMLSLPVAS